MAEPEERVVAKLKATAGVTTLVGQRIYPVYRPQDTATLLPAITYSRGETRYVVGVKNVTTTRNVRLEIDCWSDSYTEAHSVAAAVESALNNWTDATGLPVITSCMPQSKVDADDGRIEGQDVLLHRVALEYSIWYLA